VQVKSIYTVRHKALIRLLKTYRQAAGLRQVDVARHLGRAQWWISYVEKGRRRIDVIELLDLAAAIRRKGWRILREVEERNARNARTGARR